jgi:hypothetical protein
MKLDIKFVKIWSFYSFLLMINLTLNIFFWDFYSGSDTQGFGVIDPYFGMGMFYVYMIGFFNSLIVMIAKFIYPKFGMGFFIWIPYAVIGFFVEAYFEMDVLINIWGVIGYCSFGLVTGISADISFYLLKNKIKLEQGIVSGITGVIMSIVYYLLILIALTFFYKTGSGTGSFLNPGSFLGVAYFAFPWMIINSFIGGFSAYYLHVYFTNSHKK